jgi:hypothetical protein
VKLNNPPIGWPNIVTIIDTKEKGSDVNWVLHILNDAWHDRYDWTVLASNDSNIAEAVADSHLPNPIPRTNIHKLAS